MIIKKKFMRFPRYMDSKSTKISTTLWRPMHFVDKNNQYNYAQVINTIVGKMCNPHPPAEEWKTHVAAKSMP